MTYNQRLVAAKSFMDSWRHSSPGLPDLVGTAAAMDTADDWEDWLRWDPAAESLSPNSSTNHSADSITHDSSTDPGDSFSWLKDGATVNPAFVVGDDTSLLDLSVNLDTSALDFASHDPNADAFVFGGHDNLGMDFDMAPKSSRASWPAIQVPQDHVQRSGNATLTPASPQLKPRRVSASTVTTNGMESQQPSPASQAHTQSSMSTPSPQPTVPAKKKPGRKRKSEMANSGGSNAEGEPPVKKTSHNVIEKRYRNNLNDKILELRDSVPSLRAMSRPNGEDDGSEDLEGLTPAHKLNKSTIMAKATEYIKHLEKRNKTMSDDMDSLKKRLRALEQAYARSSSVSDLQSTSIGSPHTTRSRQSSNPTVSPNTNVQSPVLSSPDSSQFRHQSFAAQSPMPMQSFDSAIDDVTVRPAATVNVDGDGEGNGFMGKMMLGSMAGLMAFEGLFEHDQSGQNPNGRGLFAAPLHLFKRGTFATGGGTSSIGGAQSLIPLMKISLLLTCVAYLLLPLSRPKPKRKATLIPQITLTAAPSLAAPVETRRKAWLTAIQSVWTPRHFLLEVVAVGIRMAELSLRRLVGFDRYAELLGMTKDDEAARIKAWDIAIDAQLAGGDAEVSYYRLLLTLMASGTLPDSPIRLMQKAVHFRIFFWEVANAGYGNLFMFRNLTATVARKYWDLARTQQKALVSGTASKVDELDHAIELLPDHLAALIELECDEVLTDEIIQRAYNLAWNRPSAEKTAANPTLDKVVEDPAIRSPLDAVAAWFTNTVVDEALALSVHAEDDIPADLEYLVKLAATTAPPASSTLTRAYVAKAILADLDREANISSALESMPHVPLASPMLGRSPTTVHLNVVNHVPLTAEVRTALTLTKLLSICNPSNPRSSQSRAALALNAISLQSSHFTLLTAVAAHKLLDAYSRNPGMFSHGKSGFERLACGLRVWVGTRAGKTAGLNRTEKGMIIDRCVSVTKRIGGWRDKDDVDSGYGSGFSRRSSETTLTL